MPTYVVDVEWPTAGVEVSKNFTASIKVRDEDDVPGPPSDQFFVKCTLLKGTTTVDSKDSAVFTGSTQPLLAIPLAATDKSNHTVRAELFASGTTTPVVATDEEVNVKVMETGGASTRPGPIIIITPIED